MSVKRKRAESRILNDSLQDLQEEDERWRNRLLGRPSWNKKECSLEPLSDLSVNATEVKLTVDLPLSKENSLEVKAVDERTLEITAEMKRKIRFEDMGIVHSEGEFQKLQCRTRIPVPVHMDRMKMSLAKGILEIHLPRKT